MNKIILATAVAAMCITTVIACRWFETKKSADQVVNPLVGKWKIDSIATTNDSSSFGYLLLAMSLDDSLAYDVEFTKDTLIFYQKGGATDKTAYTYNVSGSQLILQDSTREQFVFQKQNDSSATLAAKDSNVIFLKKR